MIVKEVLTQAYDSLGRNHTFRHFVAECDECGRIYDLPHKKKHLDRLNFCSKDCQHRSKKLQRKITDTDIERYEGRGASSKLLSEKGKVTCRERYGVDHPWKNDEVRQKCISTFFKRYGSSGALGSLLLRKKYESTILSRLGVVHPMLSDVIMKKRREHSIEKYGVDHPFKAKEVADKRTATCMQRFGSSCPLASKEIQAKVDYAKANQKRRQTLLSEGRLYISTPEKELVEWLRSVFGDENVLQQSWINRCSIDAYVTSLDLYVQLDGVYWHGLLVDNHDHDLVRLRDKKLNDWIDDHQKFKLFRMNDLQWNVIRNKSMHDDLLDVLCNCRSGVNFFEHEPGYDLRKVD